MNSTKERIIEKYKQTKELYSNIMLYYGSLNKNPFEIYTTPNTKIASLAWVNFLHSVYGTSESFKTIKSGLDLFNDAFNPNLNPKKARDKIKKELYPVFYPDLYKSNLDKIFDFFNTPIYDPTHFEQGAITIFEALCSGVSIQDYFWTIFMPGKKKTEMIANAEELNSKILRCCNPLFIFYRTDEEIKNLPKLTLICDEIHGTQIFRKSDLELNPDKVKKIIKEEKTTDKFKETKNSIAANIEKALDTKVKETEKEVKEIKKTEKTLEKVRKPRKPRAKKSVEEAK